MDGLSHEPQAPQGRVVEVEGGEEVQKQLQGLWEVMDGQMTNPDGYLKSYGGLRGGNGWAIDSTRSMAGNRLVLWRRAESNPTMNDCFMELVQGELSAVYFSDISNMPLDEVSLKIISKAIRSGFRNHGAFGQEEPTPNLGVTLDFGLQGKNVINPEVSEAYPETGTPPTIVSQHPGNDFKQSHFNRFREKLAEAIRDVAQLAPKGR